MPPVLADLVAMLHRGVSLALDVEKMNSSDILNLALACSEGPGDSSLVLENYSHLDSEELRRIKLAGNGKVSFLPRNPDA